MWKRLIYTLNTFTACHSKLCEINGLAFIKLIEVVGWAKTINYFYYDFEIIITLNLLNTASPVNYVCTMFSKENTLYTNYVLLRRIENTEF